MEDGVVDFDKISSAEPSRDEMDCLKAVLAVSATGNHGKTTTLLDVIQKLLGLPPVSKRWHLKPKDKRVILKTNVCGIDLCLYIATGGDTAFVLKRNIEFFQGTYTGEWYEPDATGKLVKGTGRPPVVCPRICVTASRLYGYGVEDLEDYAQKSKVGSLVACHKKFEVDTVDCVIRLLQTLSKI